MKVEVVKLIIQVTVVNWIINLTVVQFNMSYTLKTSGDSRNFSQGVLGWACFITIFFFFRFSVTIFSFLDFSSIFFSFFFLLESNVMNTILDPVSVCLVKQNISVPINFDVPFQGVSGFIKKIKNNIYLYFLIQHKIIDPNK